MSLLTDAVTHAATTVVVVEDDDKLAYVLEKRLEQEAYLIVRIADGQKALHYLQTNKVNLIILDMMLPGLDGVTLLEAIRGIPHHEDTPVLVLTNLDMPELRADCLRFPRVSFAVKAYTPMPKVLDEIETILWGGVLPKTPSDV